MTDQTQIRVTPETHRRIKIMASAARMTIHAYVEQVFSDEWQRFSEPDVQYALLQKRIAEERGKHE